MVLALEKEKTLLIDGPARVRVLSGKTSVLGAPIEPGQEIVVRKGKRMPFEALQGSKIELTLGGSASYAEVEGSSIPPSWRDAAGEILARKESKTILVMGGVDSGKTSFSTYLANLALNSRYKVALVDGDPGQSEIGPPGAISLSFVKSPVVDLFRSNAEDLVFIGVTSPSKKIKEILDAVRIMKQEALQKGANFLIINTDGWVEGEGALSYKVRLVEAAAPDIAVAIQSGNELASILGELGDVKVFVVESPGDIKKRDRETRKLLRESAYKKYLKQAKLRSFPLSWVEIGGDMRLNTENDSHLRTRIEQIVGGNILHCEETPDCILFLLGGGNRLSQEEIIRLESEFGKRVTELHLGGEEGLLVALEDRQGKVLGIGTMRDIDYERRTMKIYTSVEQAVSKIHVGCIKLDTEGNEIGCIIENS